MDPMSRLAVDTVPVAAAMVGIVHGEGSRQDVADILNRLGSIEEWSALVVVLAAMVDPTETLDDMLGWTCKPGEFRREPGYPDPPTVANPELWPDEEAHYWSKVYRRVDVPQDVKETAHIGYREWQRRRKRRERDHTPPRTPRLA